MSNDKTPLQQCIESGQVSPEQIEAHRAVGDLGGGDEMNLRLPRTPPFPTVRMVGCSMGKTRNWIDPRKADHEFVGSDPEKEFRDAMRSQENRHLSYVKTALHRIAQELGITVEQLRAQEGKPIPYKGGTLYLIPRTSPTMPRINTEPLEIEFFNAALGAKWDELSRGALAQHSENISGVIIDEVTIPKDQRKMCIQCGRKQEADGTLTCGH